MQLASFCDIASAIASAPAALFWILSARVHVPTDWDSDAVQARAFKEIGRLNASAACSAAVAAFFQCMKILA